MQKRLASILRYATHAGALLPLVVLAWDFFSGNLTANPIQAATQRTGRTAIALLVLTLSCTPLDTLFKYRPLLSLRRPLGLYAFLYAGLHLLLYAVIDYGLDLELLVASLVEKPFILVGALAFMILLVMAVTSFRWWMVRFDKNWMRLHSLVYAAAPLVVLHYAWALKGDLFSLSGDILGPFLYGLVVFLLLTLRLKPVRRRLSGVFALGKESNSPGKNLPRAGGR